MRYPLGFLSRKATLEGTTAPGAIILGPTRVSPGAYVDASVIVGYPVRASLRNLISTRPPGGISWEELDSISRGSHLGEGVILRSGTVVYETAILEKGVETGHGVLIREQTHIGEQSLVGTGTIIDGHVTIGRRVKIESGVYIPPNTTIGDNVFLGPRAVLTNDRYPPSRRLQGPTIEDGAVIGASAVILPGIKIGREAIVAAGSVVTRDVPPRTLVAGNPAEPKSTREEYEEKKKYWEKNSK